MEMEITRERVFKIWWALAWRNLFGMVLGMILGMVLGAILGFLGAVLGLPQPFVTAVILLASLALGLYISMVPLQMVLELQFSDFRLVLVGNEQPTEPGSMTSYESPAVLQRTQSTDVAKADPPPPE